MGMVQKIYDWIKSLKTPSWLKEIFDELQGIIISTLLQIGKEYITGLSDKIIEVANMDITSEKKFKLVFQWGKQNIPDIKDSVLNLAIELLVTLCKANGFKRVIE